MTAAANRSRNSRFLFSTTQEDRITIRPWKTEMIESHGDYRAEAHLEEHIGGPLYENQRNLPRLPIPSIQETIDRFLPTALPLARTEEEKHTLKAACKDFAEQAKALQERLIARQSGEMKDSSWLQLWWNQVCSHPHGGLYKQIAKY
jgi:hypothetical protein